MKKLSIFTVIAVVGITMFGCASNTAEYFGTLRACITISRPSGGEDLQAFEKAFESALVQPSRNIATTDQ
ncbi:MAG: hypothetical protein AB1798_00140 [Spirochaetota bacterium]